MPQMLGEGTRLQSSAAACSALLCVNAKCAKSTQSSAAHLSRAPHTLFSGHPPALLQSRIQQQQQGKGAHTIYTQMDSSSLQLVLGVFSQF